MSKICFLCKSSVDNELLYGRFYSKWKLTVHYYCLLLSSNLVQRGSNDTVGIFGFLESDIRKENERTKKCRCYICKNMHANVSCCSKKCLRTFHTVCGIENGCLSHYTDTYQSWCSAHVPLEPETKPHSAEESCSICFDEMGQYDTITSIKAPCCRNGWFHQLCLARYAQSAGYFFKCPLCKNEDKFVAEVPLRGVFVPERDAAWELEPNAFQDQLLRPTACDAEDCKCQEGRTIDNRLWQLVVCGSCGSTCRHRQCMEQTSEESRVYLCQLCRPIVGERSALLENVDDSSDSSEDDTASHSDASSDEPLANIRRLAQSRKKLSDDSDSERSDGSSIQIRRFVRQNTGKRVRRLLSDASEERSDDGNANQAGEIMTNALLEHDGHKRSENKYNSTSDAPPMRIAHSPMSQTNESSGSSDRFESYARLTRQLTRRLSSLSNSSRRSTSERNSSDIQIQNSSSKRRPRIYSSSDESEAGATATIEVDDRKSKVQKERCSTDQSENNSSSSLTANRRISSSPKTDVDKRLEDAENVSKELDDLVPSKKRVRNSSGLRNGSRLSNRRSNVAAKSVHSKAGGESDPISSKRWDENSNMTGTVLLGVDRTSSNRDNDDRGNASDRSSESSYTKRTRQLTSAADATERSTSESTDFELKPNKPKRTRISTRSASPETRTENRKAADSTAHKQNDCAPQNKRRRLARVRSNERKAQSAAKQLQEPPMISPPSTPSSLSSETSQQSVASNTHSESEPVKKANPSASTPEALNRQQTSMLQYVSVSARKAAAVASDSSSDLSMDETFPPFGNRKMISKIVPTGRKQTVAAAKRRRTHSPKKCTNPTGSTVQTDKQPSPGPTSSKALVQRRTPPNRTVHKEKGQKNIMNYFNRC